MIKDPGLICNKFDKCKAGCAHRLYHSCNDMCKDTKCTKQQFIGIKKIPLKSRRVKCVPIHELTSKQQLQISLDRL